LKVGGGTGPEQKWRHRSPEKMFLVVPLHFRALKVQLVVLVSAFVMVLTVWSVSYLRLLILTVPPVPPQPFVKVGGTCPPCSMESAPVHIFLETVSGTTKDIDKISEKFYIVSKQSVIIKRKS